MADERGEISERFRRYSERPLDPLRDFFRVIVRIIGFLLAIGAILLLVLLLYSGFTAQQSGVTQVYFTKITDALNKVPLMAPLIDTLKTIQNPSRTITKFDWQADVDKNSENKELGLTFQKFSSIKKLYLPDELVSLIATVKVTSLKDNSQVRFSCTDTTSNILGIVEPSEPQVLPKDYTQIFSVRCEIPENSIKLEGKRVRAERIVLNADYDFKTDAYVEAYTMSKQLLTEKQNNLENIFENENNPRLNKETGEVHSQYTAGPMKVLVNSEFTQPFTEVGPFSNNPYYSLAILIQKASTSYQGKLSKINNVYLYLPNNFELKEDNQFELVESEDEVFNKYQLKQEKIDKLNSICRDASLLDVQCQDYWDRGFTITLTNFKVSSLNKPELDKNYIRTDVDYEFQAQTSQVVTIAESLTA